MILRRITEPCSNTVLFTETNFWNQAGILLRSERFPYQNRETDVPHTKFGRQGTRCSYHICGGKTSPPLRC